MHCKYRSYFLLSSSCTVHYFTNNHADQQVDFCNNLSDSKYVPVTVYISRNIFVPEQAYIFMIIHKNLFAYN